MADDKPADEITDLTEQQILARWEAAVADGNPDLIEAAEKEYAAIGRKPPQRKDAKAAAEARAQAATSAPEEAAVTPPQGRSSRTRQTTSKADEKETL
jgi:hypothetical protein